MFFFAFYYLEQRHKAQCSPGGDGGFFSRFVSKNSVIGLSVRQVGTVDFFSRFVSWDSGIGLSVRQVGTVVFFRVLLVRTASFFSIFTRWGRWFFSLFFRWDSGIGLSVP